MKKKVILIAAFVAMVSLSFCKQPQGSTAENADKAASSVICEDKEESGETGLFIKDKGEAKLFATVSQVYMDHYHFREIHGDSVFIIRRTGDLLEWTQWQDELWRYDAGRAEGELLFSTQGLDFRVAPDLTMICISTNEKVTVCDIKGKPLREYSPFSITEQNRAAIGFFEVLGWSDDSKRFWLMMSEGGAPSVIIAVEISNWEMKIYATEEIGLSSEYDLNLNTGKIAMSDYPFVFDSDAESELIDSGKKMSLSVYDLEKNERQQIAESQAKPFNPKWVDDNRLEFDSPDGKGKKRVTVH